MAALRFLSPIIRNKTYPLQVMVFAPCLQRFRPIIKNWRRITCFSGKNDNTRETQTPEFLRIAVSGVTELLRLFSFFSQTTTTRENLKQIDEFSVSNIDDIVSILQYDYQNAYFVTGIFSASIYAEDCIFEDPTIQFRGTELYSRNLKLLVSFFDSPSIQLKNIEKFVNSEPNCVVATWKLRTYLKLPWRPLISIDGSTVYVLDDRIRIVRHAESWSVTAVEAIGQIFTPIARTDE